MSHRGMSHREPLLTPEIEDRLDEYIEEHLPGDPNILFCVFSRDRRVQRLYPQGWPLKRIGRSLGLYMDLRRDRWDIEYRTGQTGKYYINRKQPRGDKVDVGVTEMGWWVP